MTRSDVWRKRPAVVRYRLYCDQLRSFAGKVPSRVFGILVISYLPMPPSWSKAKKDRYYGTLMGQKPDGDNIIKGVQDALFSEDSDIAVCNSIKIWCLEEEAQMRIELYHY